MSPWPGDWPGRRAAPPPRSKKRGQPFARRPRIESLEDRSLLSASPVGGEFLVNTTTSGSQTTWWETPRAVASDAQGDYVTVWGSYAQASPGVESIFAQRFNAAGQKLGGEFLVNNNVADDAEWATVGMDASGAFVIAWSQANVDGSGYGVFAQRYSSTGTAVGSVFQVNTYTQNDRKTLASSWTATAISSSPGRRSAKRSRDIPTCTGSSTMPTARPTAMSSW
jgi:hypothetical protein